MNGFLVGALAMTAVTACRKDATSPGGTVTGIATDPVLLSTGSPGKDEDPSVLRTLDGKLIIAWFSERAGNSDIYVSKSADKVTWTNPVRVTTGPNGDFYPNLLQDDQGLIHLVWFQWVAPFVGQIRHSTSADGQSWSPEESVTTTLLVDDWVPTIAQAPNGTLLVYFVSAKRDAANATNQIYVAAKRAGQTSWDPAVQAAGINSATEHDQLPFVARTGSQLALVWVRYDTSEPDFILNPKSNLYYSTSPDGFAWSAPIKVTTDPAGHNLLPQLYQRHDGSWSLLWLSTKTGAPLLYELPLANVARYPTGVTENTFLPPGYSHRMTRTPTANEYLAAWVQGPTGSQDIYYRYIRTP